MAEYKRRKPVPKTQSQLTREQIEAYDSTRGTVPASSKQNRENQISFKNDTTKLPLVTFKDINSAIFYYFQNVIKPVVIQNGQQIDVPILYGNPERWAAVQKDGFYRDGNGKIQVPLIMFKKSSIEKNRSLGNKLDGNEVSNFAVYQKKYSKRNIYDQFSRLTNRLPSEEVYGVVIPDYVTVTYQCVIFTDYVEQCDKLIEALNFASDSYWGDPERYRFRAMIDSYTPTIEMNQGQDRSVKTTFSIKLNGYIITDTYNRDKANMKKWHSKSQVNFGLETVGSLETLQAAAGTAESAAPVRFFDDPAKTVRQVSTTIISGSGLTEEGKTFLTATKIIDSTNTTVSVDVGGNTVSFLSTTIMDAPIGFTAPSQDEFQVFINGQLVEPSAISDISEISGNVVVTFNSNLNFTIEADDEFSIVGKFD